MVHESSPSDNWYHDIMTPFSILSNDLHNIIRCKKHDCFDLIEPSIYYTWNSETHRSEPRDSNAAKRTELEQVLERIERQCRIVVNGFTEMRLSARYYETSGAISAEEYAKLEDLFQQAESVTDRIKRKYFTFRGWKDMSGDEMEALLDSMRADIKILRDLIQDRYVFEREIERRLGIIHQY
jgi:hypothetical protein